MVGKTRAEDEWEIANLFESRLRVAVDWRDRLYSRNNTDKKYCMCSLYIEKNLSVAITAITSLWTLMWIFVELFFNIKIITQFFFLFFLKVIIFYLVNYQLSIERQFNRETRANCRFGSVLRLARIFLTSRCSSVKVSPLVDRFFESVRSCLAHRRSLNDERSQSHASRKKTIV